MSEIDLNGNPTIADKPSKPVCRKPLEITLVRSKIFYAKPTLTARGLVQAGFKHIREAIFTRWRLLS